ncbi:hypothetical protein MOQ_002571 [Trypanosoma cruzi marinkellei]|uniref:Uncharacterized protein n=1 Tax=Trypanosoma cruzi marinkellei TaxID=85056 RepID=K2N226_TRYCR|nr:hypothetical protein MOQ_002571 [Trypanosoma cruzi marinkellei]
MSGRGKGEHNKKLRLRETSRLQCGVKRTAERTDSEAPSKVASRTTATDVVGDEADDFDAADVSESRVVTSNEGSSKSARKEGDEHARLPLSDPVYRIMHVLPRSDFLEIVKCRFGHEECERAASYFDDSFMKNPLRHLRLQIGCDRPTGLYLFFPKLHYHRSSLRLLDLSRNDLDEDDVATLTQLLDLRSDSPSSSGFSVLEVLDLSYNRRIGNRGALFLLSALRHNDRIRAVILKGISVDDTGAVAVAPLLRQRPFPRMPADDDDEGVTFQETSLRRPLTFFLNFNENRIGAVGTEVLGKGLPAHVSLTLSKQRPFCEKKGHLARR